MKCEDTTNLFFFFFRLWICRLLLGLGWHCSCSVTKCFEVKIKYKTWSFTKASNWQNARLAILIMFMVICKDPNLYKPFVFDTCSISWLSRINKISHFATYLRSLTLSPVKIEHVIIIFCEKYLRCNEKRRVMCLILGQYYIYCNARFGIKGCWQSGWATCPEKAGVCTVCFGVPTHQLPLSLFLFFYLLLY